jgi:hypothetical protein
VLGLDICADVIIGDEMIRGISGGQKKRVTTGMHAKPANHVPLQRPLIKSSVYSWNPNSLHIISGFVYCFFSVLCRGDANRASNGFIYGRNIHWFG